MVKRRNSLNMRALMEDINRTSRILKRNILREDYGMDDNGQGAQGGMPQQGGYDDYEDMGDGQPMGNPQDMEGADEGIDQNSDQSLNVINQIRELAIQGIAQYANDVESEQYQALKKIWLLTDKFYESMDEDEEKPKKM